MSVSSEGNKILSFYHEAKQLYAGEMVIPRFVSIWLTTACDLSCPYCYFSETNKAKVFSDTEFVKKVLNELAFIGVESVELSGGGEPTLHPDCFMLAEYAANQGLKVGLITNGCRFDFDRTGFFDYIRVGLDAADPETYQKIKGGSGNHSQLKEKERFRNVLRSISFLASKRENGRPRIGLKFMIRKENYQQINQMVSLSRLSGADYCQFKLTHSEEPLDPAIIKDIFEELSILKKENPDFVMGSFSRHRATTECFMSPIHAVITAKGDILPCCYFQQLEHIIGNAFSDGFYRPWFNRRHKEIMAKIGIEQCNRVDCRWNFYNTEMKEVLFGKYDIRFI